jgi:hypothetical protein
MEAKFGPSDKGIKATDINRDDNFQKNRRMHTFGHLQKNEEMVEELKAE